MITDYPLLDLFDRFWDDYIVEHRLNNSSHIIWASIRLRQIFTGMSVRDFNWNKLMQISHGLVSNDNGKQHKFGVYALLILFIIWLDYKGFIQDNTAGLFIKYKSDLEAFVNASINKKYDLILQDGVCPSSFFKISYLKSNKNATAIIVLPYCNSKQHDFINKYFISLGKRLNDRKNRFSIEKIFNVMIAENDKLLSIHDYNDETFERHINLLLSCNKSDNDIDKGIYSLINNLIVFYLWCQSEMNESERRERFKIYTKAVITYSEFIRAYYNGYRPVNYSIYDTPPDLEKMILIHNDNGHYSTFFADKVALLDLSFLHNYYLKKWVKNCYWYDTSHVIYSRTKSYSPIFDFLTIIDNKCSVDEVPDVDLKDVIEYTSSIFSQSYSDSNKSRKVSIVKFFLRYIEDNFKIEINPMIYTFFRYHDSHTEGYKESYTKEEINRLLAAYKDNCINEDEATKKLYTLYYIIINILCISELRLSAILGLKRDCMVKVLERGGQSEYKVMSQSKETGANYKEHNITIRVKRLLDEAINITFDMANKSLGSARDYIFLCNRRCLGFISTIQSAMFRRYHRDICKKYGIRYLPPSAIRNHYMQAVSNYVDDIGGDIKLIEILGQHGINVHIKHYDKVEIKDFCEKFYNIEIGNIKLKGSVKKSSNYDKSHTVLNGCGYCDADKCVLSGLLDCLMCDKFVSTIDCIPYFESSIKALDKKIYDTKIMHEKEFLVSKKKLYVKYLELLYELEERSKNE